MTVRAGDREIILDAGSGLVTHSNDLVARQSDTRQPVQAYLFISHAHLDHLIGLPYFAPMYMPSSTVSIWGPKNMRFDSFEDTVDALVSPPFFPVPRYEMQASFNFSDIAETDVVYFVDGQDQPVQCQPGHPDSRPEAPEASTVDLTVECMRGYSHPKSGVNIYKVSARGRSVVYATDMEGFVNGDRRLIEYAKGADLLVHDAMYTNQRYTSVPGPTQGYGHSTVDMATRLADAADVDQLLLFHHDPTNDDDTLAQVEARGQSLFENTRVARDEMVVEL